MPEPMIVVEMAAPHVAVVALNRPPVNAMSTAIREEFVAVFDRLGDDPAIRAIILTGRGKLFCAGADIKEKRDLAAADGGYAKANRLTRDSFFALLESPKPVIAAVNGGALGAGFVMAACCDLIVASEDAFFAMPEIDVGQGGGAAFLQRIMPQSKMRRMMLTGERIGAREFHRLGIIEECVPAVDLLTAAVSIASTIAEKSPTAVRTIRRSFNTVNHLPLYEGFRLEQGYTTELSTSADAAEARRAFFEKRKPRFE